MASLLEILIIPYATSPERTSGVHWVNGSTGSNRVIRGGSWNNDADNCRVSNRNWNGPDNRNNNVGFRPANTAPFEWFVFYGKQTGESAVPPLILLPVHHRDE